MNVPLGNIEKDSIVITIKDNGGGISQENSNNIFKQYFTTKDTQGSGIGLYMSKLIIENNMNGNLTVSNKNEGASFRIEL